MNGEPSVEDDKHLEDWEQALLDEPNQPELYDVVDVMMLRRHVNRAALAVIAIYVLLGLLNVQWVRQLFSGTLPAASALAGSLSTLLGAALIVILQIALTYIPLRALAEILRILMQMEFSSRKAAGPTK